MDDTYCVQCGKAPATTSTYAVLQRAGFCIGMRLKICAECFWVLEELMLMGAAASMPLRRKRQLKLPMALAG